MYISTMNDTNWGMQVEVAKQVKDWSAPVSGTELTLKLVQENIKKLNNN